MVYRGTRTPPVARILFKPPASPYINYVAGEGVVESAYKNIIVGVSFNELVTDVYCFVGQIIKQGNPLFKQDTRRFEAQLKQAEADYKVAQIDYENQSVQYAFYEKLKDKSAVSEQAYKLAYYNEMLAKQRMEAALAAVKVIKTDIERSTVLAPIDGEVLQVSIRPGQFANQNPFNQQSLILFGDTNIYHLRVDIDEEDSWRVIKGAPGTAFLRGNSKIMIPLEFAYAEPYIVPKTSLSGADTERVDTRVLQVVYKFPKDQYPVFAGELLDVYLQAKPYGAE